MKFPTITGLIVAALGAAMTVTAGLEMASIGFGNPGFIANGWLAGLGCMTVVCGLFVADPS
jgi:hypothetical protein